MHLTIVTILQELQEEQSAYSQCEQIWCTVEEEHGILTYNGWMFSLPHFHFQFKSVSISTILTIKLKRIFMFGDLFLGYHLKYTFLE